ncbi:hypothetical protein EDD18DRAFT_339150 [Armillaria luteobubalina]|uniref:Uncharacterized protein n=1 Tax=Armillaria luteobubalina TaxID=153913 RepID=A0AA39QM82_9AGAR|nr:hypothetical protein EDD18DRAFT_339150 [Armillaria luteobubalina]
MTLSGPPAFLWHSEPGQKVCLCRDGSVSVIPYGDEKAIYKAWSYCTPGRHFGTYRGVRVAGRFSFFTELPTNAVAPLLIRSRLTTSSPISPSSSLVPPPHILSSSYISTARLPTSYVSSLILRNWTGLVPNLGGGQNTESLGEFPCPCWSKFPQGHVRKSVLSAPRLSLVGMPNMCVPILVAPEISGMTDHRPASEGECLST